MKLFTDATIKLAGWYLLILMLVSLLFSVMIFQVTQSEIESRLIRITNKSGVAPPNRTLSPGAREQLEVATGNILISLAYINVVILLAGGTGSYFLARRTLRPIELAHEAQSRFVSNASHQLRTPLAIMKAETEMALDDNSAKKADLRATLLSNLEEVNHLTELSSMLLDLSRSEGSLGEAVAEVDLVGLIESIITTRRDRKISLTAPESLILHSHEAALRELFHILIDNAIKHSPTDSPITISLVENRQLITCSISNAGSGISKEKLPHIFERFYSTKEADGYGLGLSLARQLVKALGGYISVDSQPNKQTTFSVAFPRNHQP